MTLPSPSRCLPASTCLEVGTMRRIVDQSVPNCFAAASPPMTFASSLKPALIRCFPTKPARANASGRSRRISAPTKLAELVYKCRYNDPKRSRVTPASLKGRARKVVCEALRPATDEIVPSSEVLDVKVREVSAADLMRWWSDQPLSLADFRLAKFNDHRENVTMVP